MNSLPQHSRGFTLVEISIVMIIIGFLAAAILIGNDLIRAAGLRGQISQIEKINTAVATFRGKYNCLPGDCAEAVSFGFGTPGGPGDNGDGDGRITRVIPDDMDGNEIRNVWQHLGMAGMLESTPPDGKVPGINSPALKYSGFGVGSGPDVNIRGGVWMGYFELPSQALGAGNPISAWALTSTATGGEQSGIYLPADAYYIDNKIDDGLPFMGNVHAGGGTLQITCAAGQDVTCGGYDAIEVSAPNDDEYCIDSQGMLLTTSQYRLSATIRSATSLCMLLIKAPLY